MSDVADLPAESEPNLPATTRPGVTVVASEVLNEFMKDLGPYALAGAGYLVVMIPLIFVSIIVMYIGMGVAMALMMMLAALAGSIVGELGGLVVSLVGTFLVVALIFAFAVGLNGLVAPLHASLYRAIAKHQRRDPEDEVPTELSFGSAFSTVTTAPLSAAMIHIMVTGAVIVGLVFCYIGALVPVFFLMYAPGLVFVDGLSPIDAIKRSVATARENLGWHAGHFGLSMVIGMFSGYIPIIGPMFAQAYSVKIHRVVFGDHPEAELV